MAQAVAACEMDPLTVREGKNELFGKHYETIFPNSEAGFYLTRYWARRHIRLASVGKPQRSYAGWMALHFLWSRLSPVTKGEDRARRFWRLCERKELSICKPLAQAIDVIFMELLKYYAANKGTGAATLDHSTFFRNKRGRHLEFEKFWKNEATRTAKFDAAWAKVVAALKGEQG